VSFIYVYSISLCYRQNAILLLKGLVSLSRHCEVRAILYGNASPCNSRVSRFWRIEDYQAILDCIGINSKAILEKVIFEIVR
jgi:hypothetical protein